MNRYIKTDEFSGSSFYDINDENAQAFLDEVMPLQGEWKQCLDFFEFHKTYCTLIVNAGNALGLCGRYKESIDILNEGLATIKPELKFSYNHKANIYQCLAINYCHLLDDKKALENFRLMAYNEFQNLNRTSYGSINFYSFRSPTEYAIKDIKDNTISFSALDAFNDPVDSAFFKIADIEREKLTAEWEILASKLISQVYGDFRARCLVSNLDLNKMNEDFFNPTPAIYLSDKPEYLNTLMWGHYTDYHAGFCIKYNFQGRITDHDDSVEVMLAQMNYQDSMPYDTTMSFQKAFLTKNSDWSYENEKRLLYCSSRPADALPTVTLKPSSIKAIYLGVKCSKKTRWEILKAVEDKPDVLLYQMQICYTDIYSLEAVQIKREDIEEYRDN